MLPLPHLGTMMHPIQPLPSGEVRDQTQAGALPGESLPAPVAWAATLPASLPGQAVPGRPSRTRKAVGFALLGLGGLGLVLPVLQGGLFLALGLFVLRDQYPWAHRGMEWARRRWPVATGRLEALEARIFAWGGRQARRLRALFRRG
ncbi:PGPGW domain-containing protein [Crenalkalicoccus roseus]|uniref:PGPGW domain-containing protein n=1 Tax=Crenalkalicoccus roseus TaxID=1485588 RepID=UPI0010812DC3|nr:PGPGW domain-containing protein [Crenalkalicoccus roseus]